MRRRCATRSAAGRTNASRNSVLRLEGDCVQTCEAQSGLVGIACISAINSTIECLGTCDVESLTVEQQLACQDEAQAISAACD